jgi:hypothetical protein
MMLFCILPAFMVKVEESEQGGFRKACVASFNAFAFELSGDLATLFKEQLLREEIFLFSSIESDQFR